MGFCDRNAKLHVHTNADSPSDAARALEFGAMGIGLFRTEHMFYGEGSDEPLYFLRKMILAEGIEARKVALAELFPFMKASMKGTIKAMAGKPVTIRLLDPPLHEFVPQSEAGKKALSDRLGITLQKLAEIAERLHESNPMMGHRGCRLGISYPEITEVQARAILEATSELRAEGVDARPEIMVPLTVMEAEFTHQKAIVNQVKAGLPTVKDVPVGTMIETPRGALQAGKIASADCEFFSFGTNDLTQLTFGFSRDDVQSFLPDYDRAGLVKANVFASIDQDGVGELVRLAVQRGREANPKLHIGVCGEHGGDPASIAFFHTAGLDYVSCSPFRVPIARLAAARANIEASK
jgi:pyruvate,orthophosphate dikinase